MTPYPRHIKAHHSGLLAEKIRQARSILTSCTICPRHCRVNRINNEKGYCLTGKMPVIASYMPHFGEEPQISGSNGSGTLFFSHCNLRCRFCQNWEISISGQGCTAGKGQIASIMLLLQEKGCHNINLVTPTHVVPQILADLAIAVENGFSLPIVYNSSGYESVETLKLLDGIVDIYMPDFKFWDSDISDAVCSAPDYPRTAKNAIIEMHRQVGDLETDSKGIARSGLLVRHLVLPQGKAGTSAVMNFLKNKISGNTHVNIMSQYHPAGDAGLFPWLSRPVTVKEFHTARQTATDLGLVIVR